MILYTNEPPKLSFGLVFAVFWFVCSFFACFCRVCSFVLCVWLVFSCFLCTQICVHKFLYTNGFPPLPPLEKHQCNSRCTLFVLSSSSSLWLCSRFHSSKVCFKFISWTCTTGVIHSLLHSTKNSVGISSTGLF